MRDGRFVEARGALRRRALVSPRPPSLVYGVTTAERLAEKQWRNFLDAKEAEDRRARRYLERHGRGMAAYTSTNTITPAVTYIVYEPRLYVHLYARHV